MANSPAPTNQQVRTKVRVILTNDLPKTVADQKQLILDANPGFLIDGINVNPIEKDQQRQGTFEVDFHLVPEAGDYVQQLLVQATAQAADIIRQHEQAIAQLTKDNTDLEKENRELKKKDR